MAAFHARRFRARHTQHCACHYESERIEIRVRECQDSAMQAAIDTSPRRAFLEHRWGRRIPCHAALQLRAPDGSITLARLRDLSTSGAFIETTRMLAICSPVDVAILDADGVPRRQILKAMVVRRAVDGLGIEWNETPAGPVCPALGCTTTCAAAC
jgi:hypothetical protein